MTLGQLGIDCTGVKVAASYVGRSDINDAVSARFYLYSATKML